MFVGLCAQIVNANDAEDVTAAAQDLYIKIAAKDLDGVARYIPKQGFTELSPNSNDFHQLALNAFENLFKSGAQVNFHIENIHVQLFEKTAVITGTRVGSITPQNAAPIETSFPLTMVWSKSKTGWKLHHVHLSAPAVK